MEKLFCSEMGCLSPVAHLCCTQFAGDHPYCEEHAAKEKEKRSPEEHWIDVVTYRLREAEREREKIENRENVLKWGRCYATACSKAGMISVFSQSGKFLFRLCKYHFDIFNTSDQEKISCPVEQEEETKARFAKDQTAFIRRKTNPSSSFLETDLQRELTVTIKPASTPQSGDVYVGKIHVARIIWEKTETHTGFMIYDLHGKVISGPFEKPAQAIDSVLECLAQ